MPDSDDDYVGSDSGDETHVIARAGKPSTHPPGASKHGGRGNWEVARTWENVVEGEDGTISSTVDGLLEAGKRQRLVNYFFVLLLVANLTDPHTFLPTCLNMNCIFPLLSRFLREHVSIPAKHGRQKAIYRRNHGRVWKPRYILQACGRHRRCLEASSPDCAS